ncbi:MAG: hypothetical protein Crog4KO_02980 [Crocinitomicaceae bacterium]
MLTKIRKLVSFEKLEAPLRRQLLNQYPEGFDGAVMRIEAPKPFYAVILESEQVTYLVKLNNNLINLSHSELEDEFQDDEPSEILEDDDNVADDE